MALTEAQAQAVASAAGSEAGKLTSSGASLVIRAWLRARGLVADRWGNFVEGDGKTRWKFKDRVVDKQYRSSAGDWRNQRSIPLIDAAQELLREAGVALGKTELVEKVTAAKQKRGQQAEKGALKRGLERAREVARVVAIKQVGYTSPELLPRLHEPEGQNAVRQVAAEVLPLMQAGRHYPDSMFASLERPPLAPLFEPLSLRWDVGVEGVVYTVEIANRAKNVVNVHLGKSEGHFAVDPYSHQVMLDRGMRKGDGFITGTIHAAQNGKLVAVLFMAMSAEKQKGAGSRLVALWCALMRGYGIRDWVAQAVGDEGLAFLRALERKGELRLLAQRGSDYRVACTTRGDQLLLPVGKGGPVVGEAPRA